MVDEKKTPVWQQGGASGTSDASSAKEATQQFEAGLMIDTASPAATSSSTEPSNGGTKQEQREQIRQFLKDDGVAGQSIEKKRSFLRSKGMPINLIDEELQSVQTAENIPTSDFEAFQKQAMSTPVVENPLPMGAPPIITYPEFLANAHRPEPLITPGRILTTTYIASAAAALLYGASALLVKPMTGVLTHARHEFADHSLTKIDELNARLEKMVSQIPGAKAHEDLSEGDADGVTSDPTELFHRDASTQTDTSTGKNVTQVAFVNGDSAVAQAEKMKSLEKELDTLLSNIQKQGDATREREESVSKLRHYLDSLAYSGGINVWSNQNMTYGWENSSSVTKDSQKSVEKRVDPIEELKREIRGVKGVLLSAKRFPAVAQQGGHRHRTTPAAA